MPVVQVERVEDRPGGAGNVALNIASLGGDVRLVGLVGADNAAKVLRNLLTDAGVHCDFVEVENSSTITKLRSLAHNQQLLRLDFEDGFNDFSPEILAAKVEKSILDCDVLVLSDYGKGALRKVQMLIDLAREHGVSAVVDPKGREFSRYRGAMIVTPNFGEFEAVAGSCIDEADIESRADRLRRELDLTALLVTRSENGMSLFRRDGPALHYAVHAREIYDVTGAGISIHQSHGRLRVGLHRCIEALLHQGFHELSRGAAVHGRRGQAVHRGAVMLGDGARQVLLVPGDRVDVAARERLQGGDELPVGGIEHRDVDGVELRLHREDERLGDELPGYELAYRLDVLGIDGEQ